MKNKGAKILGRSTRGKDAGVLLKIELRDPKERSYIAFVSTTQVREDESAVGEIEKYFLQKEGERWSVVKVLPFAIE
jgi:hypothetical protein